MQIRNEFSIPLPPAQAYAILLDLEQVTDCLPGAELGAERADGSRAVKVTVKLGPMRFVYDGAIRGSERDDAARRAVLVGQARETRGQGTAQATITMSVSGKNASSRVESVAEVELTGRAAQMGRGVVEDVAKKMIADMVRCLEERFAKPRAETDASGGAPPAEQEVGAPAASSSPGEPESLRAGSLFWTVLVGRIRALFRRR